MVFCCHVYFQDVKSCSCLGGWEESFGESQQSDSVGGDEPWKTSGLCTWNREGLASDLSIIFLANELQIRGHLDQKQELGRDFETGREGPP